MTLAYNDDPDPELHSYTHLYADRRPWRPGTVDGILREVADDVLRGVIITDDQPLPDRELTPAVPGQESGGVRHCAVPGPKRHVGPISG